MKAKFGDDKPGDAPAQQPMGSSAGATGGAKPQVYFDVALNDGILAIILRYSYILSSN